MLFQTHTVQVAQDVVVSWNVQKRQLQLCAYQCFRTSTCDTAHETNNSGDVPRYSKISVIAQ